jgi:trans-L-3-hydroxyproline dehydratase
MVHVVRTIDAHVGGQPLRLIVDGAPRLSGKTMAQKRDSMRRQGDNLRRAVVLEPRGHMDMCAALLTEPISPGAHAGVLFMHAAGFAAMAGHSVIAVATIALERGLISTASEALAFDTVAGTVNVRARIQTHGERRRVDSVAFTNVPSFVAAPGHAVRIGTRPLRVDIAFGGLFYAIVDTEAIGIPIDSARVPELRRLGVEIRDAVNASGAIEHPVDRALSGIAGVIFTGPPQDPEAHLRNVTVFGNGAVDRSPSGTGTSAVMAVLDAMGLLPDRDAFVHESVIGSLFRGRIARRTQVGEFAAIVPEVEGTAIITGEHTLYIDDDDPLRDGFAL